MIGSNRKASDSPTGIQFAPIALGTAPNSNCGNNGLNRLFPVLSLVACLVIAPMAVMSHNYAVGALRISHPWIRPTPISAPTAAGYLIISNTGSAPDRFLGGASPLAAQIQIHLMSVDGGIMRMRPIAGGLVLPPHSTVRFEAGSYHLMLVTPKRPFRTGDKIPVTLQFARAGAVHVEFQVQTEHPVDAGNRMREMDMH